MASFNNLRLLTRSFLADEKGILSNRLVMGFGFMDSALSGIDLWKLAETVKEKPDLKKMILNSNRFEEIEEKIREIPGGGEFLLQWRDFMTKHGHHCRGEVDVLNPRWSETPDYILDVIRNSLGGDVDFNPLKEYEKRKEEGEKLMEECGKKLNPLLRSLFCHLVIQSRNGLAFRENVKSEFVRMMAVLRFVLLKIGKKLIERGDFNQREDIFFLELDEIKPVVMKKANFDVRETVQARREEFDKNLLITPPAVVIGSWKPEDKDSGEQERELLLSLKPHQEGDIKVLSGLPVSCGVAEGRARVILRQNNHEKVLPGEILIAPFTDPGWTPYFIPALGIVVDMGGMLSHGSIVARELGIPAVVNVGNATSIIKTGQKVRVDGNEGRVFILD